MRRLAYSYAIFRSSMYMSRDNIFTVSYIFMTREFWNDFLRTIAVWRTLIIDFLQATAC